MTCGLDKTPEKNRIDHARLLKAYSDYVRGRVGNNFDSTLDQEYAGAKVEEGTPIKYVLKLGYCFPNSRIATHPVKSIILV